MRALLKHSIDLPCKHPCHLCCSPTHPLTHPLTHLLILPTPLATGPYSLNGVPLRRVNQAYVIVTSQAVDISGVKLPATLNDAYFKAPADGNKEGTILEAGAAKKPTETSAQRKADQKAVDDAVLAGVKKVAQLDGYLKTRFSLKKGVKPHEIKF